MFNISAQSIILQFNKTKQIYLSAVANVEDPTDEVAKIETSKIIEDALIYQNNELEEITI